jgi:hypothetical protein
MERYEGTFSNAVQMKPGDFFAVQFRVDAMFLEDLIY